MLKSLDGARRVLASFAMVLALTAIIATPALAITHGTSDQGAHPYVGLMTAHAANGNYLWRCSGTLVDATHFITAGHCTDQHDGAASAVVYFDQGPITPDPNFTLETRSCTAGIDGNPVLGYPCGGASTVHGAFTGAIYTHPDFYNAPWFTHDLGVVVLSDAGYNPGSFAALPAQGSLNSLKVGRNTTFTSVGYGLQASFPDAAAWKDKSSRERQVAHPWLHQINRGIVGDFSLLLSNNASSGGTCFGDSGGPNFLGNSNVIAGVTSFGMNPTCGGTGGVYRLDGADDVAWLATFGL